MQDSLKDELILKVGLPKYLNTLPLLYYLKVPKNVYIELKTPKEINQALEKEKIDLGLASSIYYAQNFSKLFLLPDISISATGKVKSVILYHQIPLKKLEGKIIGISPETETSFALLRLVLEDFLKIRPKYLFLNKKYSENFHSSERTLDAYLAIGDEALKLSKGKFFSYATDLAELWLKKTKLPFVFALMVGRKAILYSKRDLIEKFIHSLYLSRAKGLSSLQFIVENSHLKLRKDFAIKYLQHLEYDFSGLKQRSFLQFCKLLTKKEIIPKIPDLYFFPLNYDENKRT